MQGGYTGKLLRADLTAGVCSIEELTEEQVRPFIGCSGYAAKILWDELAPDTDPLGPENKLVFATGPVTGTLCPSGGSYELCFKSPASLSWSQSRSGGSFGPKLKYAGFDFLVVEGRAENPVYLWVRDGQAEIRDASRVWGSGVEKTTDFLLAETGDRESSVAAIGPAGEKMVRFAAVINDRGRAAGRGGGGAVMGSKNLKAVVVNGSGNVPVHDLETWKALMVEAEENLKRYPFEGVNQFGTPLLVGIQNAAGALPTRNFVQGQFAAADKIGGEALTEKHLVKRRACFGCCMGCGRYSVVEGGPWETPGMEGPEYETLASLGSLTLTDDLPAILRGNYLCNDYGLDTISTGVSIAFAIECYQNGLLGPEVTGGREFCWGDPELVMDLVRMIAFREGAGDLLAEGVRRAAETIGGDAMRYALEVKGLEVPMHEPRGESKVMALQYAVNPRGACHMHPNWAGIWDSVQFECGMNGFGQPWPPTDKMEETGSQKGLAYRYVSIQGEISEIIGGCVFHSWGAADECLTPDLYARMLRALVGWDIDAEELFRAADRSWVLKRCFNLREGFGRSDDRIPVRLTEPIEESGPSEGSRVRDIDGMLREYYQAAGWDPATGVPEEATLEALGLSFVTGSLGGSRAEG